MNRRLLIPVATALLLGTSAGAQLWDGDNYSFRLKGCYAVRDQVRCDFTYVLTGADTTQINTNARHYEVVTMDGRTLQATGTSVGGQPFYNAYTDSVATAYRGAPVQVSVLFDVANVTSLRVLAVLNRPMNNVPVARSASAVTSSAPATPPAVSTPAPNAGVPTGFSLTLSSCKVAAGVYTCTATLTPRR